MSEPQAESAPLEAGAELPEGHRVEEVLGVGRIATAYVVTSPSGERRAATVLHADHLDELREWFVKSAWLRESIEHAHMPRTFVVGMLDDGRPVEVAELLEGESLRDALTNRSVPLPLPVVARIVREAATALDHLHGMASPVVHRALTPDNVLLTAPDGLVKLLGVGDADRPQFEGVRASYQSPEALAEITALTGRADIFVLASIAFEAITGRAAFTGTADEVLGALHASRRPSARALRADVPGAVDDVLARCWDLTPDRRPATAADAARELTEALGVEDTAEMRAPKDATGPVVAPLQVVRRRSAVLGPTLEMEAPDFGSASRSFLDAVEQTEVSSRKVAPRANPVAPKPTGRAPGRKRLEVTPPTAPASSAAHDDEGVRTLDGTRPEPVAAEPQRAPSPFARDRATTLEASAPAYAAHDEQEPTPRLHSPVPAPVPAPEAAPVMPTLTGIGPQAPPPPDAPPPSSDMPPTLPVGTPVTPLPSVSVAMTPVPMQSPQHASPAPAQPAAPTLPAAPAQPAAPTLPVPSSAPTLPPPRPDRAPRVKAPDAVAFPDEPTGTLDVVPAPPRSPWRSPVVIAAIFVANALVIVGVAHAIALVATREPVVRVVQTPAPAPVCAACAPCPACPPPSAAAVQAAVPARPAAQPAAAPVRTQAPAIARPAAPRPVRRAAPMF